LFPFGNLLWAAVSLRMLAQFRTIKDATSPKVVREEYPQIKKYKEQEQQAGAGRNHWSLLVIYHLTLTICHLASLNDSVDFRRSQIEK